MPALPPIYFIRHGQTDWNEQGLIQGTVETDLNATGIRQAEAVASALAHHEPELRAYDFYVSPQQRAQQTMKIICAAQPRDFASVQTEPRVRELGFGVWEGKPFWELKDNPLYPADAEGHYEWRPEGGESYADGVARVDGFLSALTRPTLIVAHGAVGRCIIGFVCGLAGPSITRLPTPQGMYCLLKDGRYQWYDESHQPL